MEPSKSMVLVYAVVEVAAVDITVLLAELDLLRLVYLAVHLME